MALVRRPLISRSILRAASSSSSLSPASSPSEDSSSPNASSIAPSPSSYTGRCRQVHRPSSEGRKQAPDPGRDQHTGCNLMQHSKPAPHLPLRRNPGRTPPAGQTSLAVDFPLYPHGDRKILPVFFLLRTQSEWHHLRKLGRGKKWARRMMETQEIYKSIWKGMNLQSPDIHGHLTQAKMEYQFCKQIYSGPKLLLHYGWIG